MITITQAYQNLNEARADYDACYSHASTEELKVTRHAAFVAALKAYETDADSMDMRKRLMSDAPPHFLVFVHEDGRRGLEEGGVYHQHAAMLELSDTGYPGNTPGRADAYVAYQNAERLERGFKGHTEVVDSLAGIEPVNIDVWSSLTAWQRQFVTWQRAPIEGQTREMDFPIAWDSAAPTCQQFGERNVVLNGVITVPRTGKRYRFNAVASRGFRQPAISAMYLMGTAHARAVPEKQLRDVRAAALEAWQILLKPLRAALVAEAQAAISSPAKLLPLLGVEDYGQDMTREGPIEPTPVTAEDIARDFPDYDFAEPVRKPSFDPEFNAARRVVRRALKAGYTLSVDTGGDERDLTHSTDAQAVCEALRACDESTLILHKEGNFPNARRSRIYGSILFVFGNAADGSEIVSDINGRAASRLIDDMQRVKQSSAERRKAAYASYRKPSCAPGFCEGLAERVWQFRYAKDARAKIALLQYRAIKTPQYFRGTYEKETRKIFNEARVFLMNAADFREKSEARGLRVPGVPTPSACLPDGTPITVLQWQALRIRFGRSPDGAQSFSDFLARVEVGRDCLMLPWCGMWLGVETDGHTHS